MSLFLAAIEPFNYVIIYFRCFINKLIFTISTFTFNKLKCFLSNHKQKRLKESAVVTSTKKNKLLEKCFTEQH